MQNPQIAKESLSPEQIGSRGGGPALTVYGKTTIVHHSWETSQSIQPTNSRESQGSKGFKGSKETRKSNSTLHNSSTFQSFHNVRFSISINGQDATQSAKTSLTVLKLMDDLLPEKTLIHIHHHFELPLGAGYGSSGAGSLGIAFGLNYLFKLNLTSIEAAKFAHIAEVENHTGLGTVAGQFMGGLSIVNEPGYPFITRQIPVPKDLLICIASWGGISTKQILTDPEYRQLIYRQGKKAMIQMQTDWSLENYLAVCRKFLANTDMLNGFELPQIKLLLDQLNQNTTYGASLNMLGKSVFCFCTSEEKPIVEQLMKQFSPTFGPKFVSVSEHGILHSKANVNSTRD
ncbi:MAG: GHMP family kinase ATP-binding protein [Promethearchaeota archaeon]